MLQAKSVTFRNLSTHTFPSLYTIATMAWLAQHDVRSDTQKSSSSKMPKGDFYFGFAKHVGLKAHDDLCEGYRCRNKTIEKWTKQQVASR